MCGVLMRVMGRTREVEAGKEETDNLDQLDQTRHASSTLGECETLLARSFTSPGPLCPTFNLPYIRLRVMLMMIMATALLIADFRFVTFTFKVTQAPAQDPPATIQILIAK